MSDDNDNVDRRGLVEVGISVTFSRSNKALFPAMGGPEIN
jgi:hypothetical protein